MNIRALILKMIVLFFSIAVGFVGAKTKVLTKESNKAISRLIINITNPLLILSSVMGGEHLLTNAQVLLLTVIAAGTYAVLIPSSFLVSGLLRVPKEQDGLYRYMYIFSNVAFIGYPLVSSLFGDSAIFYVSIFVLMFQLVVWSYGTSLMKGERFRWEWSILKSPSILAALAAYAIYCSGVTLPAVCGDACSFVGNLTSPLAMLVIGCSLGQVKLGSVFSNGRIYVMGLIKLVVLPLAAWFALHFFVTNALILGVTVIVLAMPTATNTTLVAYEYGADETLASAGVFLTTLLSLVTVPAVMTLLFG